MYVRHPPTDHSKWKKCKEERKKYIPPRVDKPAAAATTGPTVQPPAQQEATSSAPGMLQLNSELKQVLASFGLSDHDAESVWNQAYSQALAKN